MEYYKWSKGISRHLGYNFISLEFDCQCRYEDCVTQTIAKELIDKLDAVRNTTRHPLQITSGYRCAKHQKDLSKDPNIETVENSQHCLGHAADIKSTADNLLVTVKHYFNSIGVAKTWMHVDLRGYDGKIREWKYKK